MEPARKQPQGRTNPTKPADQRLQDVVARVREDARREPGGYLRDSEVPAGGE